jgi:hypothetical protein
VWLDRERVAQDRELALAELVLEVGVAEDDVAIEREKEAMEFPLACP